MKKLSLFFLLTVILSYSCNKSSNENSVVLGGVLEVYNVDLGIADFSSAEIKCKNLGRNWRLPTRKEWELICNNKEKVQNLLNNGTYWTSEINPNSPNSIYGYFNTSSLTTSCSTGNYLYKNETWSIRPVRSL